MDKKIFIAKRLRTYREENRLTQLELGNRLGVSAQAVCKWERGICYPDIFLLPDLARLLGCQIDDLFRE